MGGGGGGEGVFEKIPSMGEVWIFFWNLHSEQQNNLIMYEIIVLKINGTGQHNLLYILRKV